MNGTILIDGDFNNTHHKNAVVGLSLRNNFYTDAIWNMVMRKLTPNMRRMLTIKGVSNKDIEGMEERAFRKYSNYDWGFKLLMKNDVAIGFTFWDYPKQSSHPNGKGCCLEYLLVDADHRGKKYGTLLMDDFVSWADIHRPVIKIQFKPDRVLVKLYKKYGFKEGCPEGMKQDPVAAGSGLVEWYRN
jgi:GNAT superfamily N-acetyltransferase